MILVRYVYLIFCQERETLMKNDEMKKAFEVVDSEIKKLESQKRCFFKLAGLSWSCFLAGGTEG